MESKSIATRRRCEWLTAKESYEPLTNTELFDKLVSLCEEPREPKLNALLRELKNRLGVK